MEGDQNPWISMVQNRIRGHQRWPDATSHLAGFSHAVASVLGPLRDFTKMVFIKVFIVWKVVIYMEYMVWTVVIYVQIIYMNSCDLYKNY